MKRRIYELRPEVDAGWYLSERAKVGATFLAYTKKEAVSKARRIVRKQAPSQLLIFTLRGTIEKGRNGEASYQADSKRRPG